MITTFTDPQKPLTHRLAALNTFVVGNNRTVLSHISQVLTQPDLPDELLQACFRACFKMRAWQMVYELMPFLDRPRTATGALRLIDLMLHTKPEPHTHQMLKLLCFKVCDNKTVPDAASQLDLIALIGLIGTPSGVDTLEQIYRQWRSDLTLALAIVRAAALALNPAAPAFLERVVDDTTSRTLVDECRRLLALYP